MCEGAFLDQCNGALTVEIKSETPSSPAATTDQCSPKGRAQACRRSLECGFLGRRSWCTEDGSLPGKGHPAPLSFLTPKIET